VTSLIDEPAAAAALARGQGADRDRAERDLGELAPALYDQPIDGQQRPRGPS
jgi:hypothetical protein